MQKRPGRPSDRLYPGLSEERSVAKARAVVKLWWVFATTAGGKGKTPSQEARDTGNPRADLIEVCERMWVLTGGRKLKFDRHLRQYLEEVQEFETWLASRPPGRGRPRDLEQTVKTLIAICGVHRYRLRVRKVRYSRIGIGPGAVGDVWQVLFDESVTRSAMKSRIHRTARLVGQFVGARGPAGPGEKRDDRLRKAVERLTIN